MVSGQELALDGHAPVHGPPAAACSTLSASARRPSTAWPDHRGPRGSEWVGLTDVGVPVCDDRVMVSAFPAEMWGTHVWVFRLPRELGAGLVWGCRVFSCDSLLLLSAPCRHRDPDGPQRTGSQPFPEQGGRVPLDSCVCIHSIRKHTGPPSWRTGWGPR